MKTIDRINKQTKIDKTGLKRGSAYYFHVDEDFREDWDWGKRKMIASKTISKPANKFEV